MGQPWPLFVGFRSFQKGILQKKTVSFNGFRTWIVGVEGKHTDHLTTTSLAPIQIQIYSEICTFENATTLACLWSKSLTFSALMASTGIQASKPEVRMADKIAMRSLVLSKTLPRIGGLTSTT